VNVVGDAGTGNPTEVPAQVVALRAVDLGEGAHSLSGEAVYLEHLLVVELVELANMTQRGDQQMTRGVRELVQQDECASAPSHDEAFLIAIVPGRTEDAAGLLLGAAHVLEPPGCPERFRHEPLLSGAGTFLGLNRAGLILLAAALVALGGASSVQAWHDPEHECFGATQTMVGTPGNDVMTGTPEADVIKAGAGDDTIDGGGGNDVLCGEDGNDTILGGAGDDAISGDGGDDHVDGGEGYDVAFFYWSPVGVNASLETNTATGWGTDKLANFEGLVGSLHDDTLSGDPRGNLLDGRAGNDTLLGGGGPDGLDGDVGNDLLDGGPGTDLVFYDYSPSAVVASLASHTGRGWGTDTYRGVEDLHGSQQGDVLVGNGGPNVLNGHKGNDRITGGGGNDTIFGEQGNERLLGGPGRDRLNGGPGRDQVDGGSGRDVCLGERKRRCP
jgi:Ca2+-binding RTX toxin-like protein